MWKNKVNNVNNMFRRMNFTTNTLQTPEDQMTYPQTNISQKVEKWLKTSLILDYTHIHTPNSISNFYI